MPDASFVQASFLGGEWSPYAQGRIDHPKYRTAMNVALNVVPIEEGAAPRRPGTAYMSHTRNGAAGRVIDFDFTDSAPYVIEMTDGHLRLFTGLGHVFTADAKPIVNISNENPAVVSLGGTVAWVTGDQVEILFQNAQNTVDGAILRRRQFIATMLDTDQFTLSDPLTGLAVDGATVNWDPTQVSAQAARILDIVTPYTGGLWSSVRKVQAAGVGPSREDAALFLHPTIKPQVLFALPNPSGPNVATFTFGAQDFNDGPYLDIVPNSQMTPNAISGTITLTLSYTAWSATTDYTLGQFVTSAGVDYQSISETNLNNTPASSPTFWRVVNSGGAVGINGFVSTDVGRSIRLLSEPPLWAVGTAYTPGNAVKFNGAYYVAQTTSTGAQPDVSVTEWNVTTSQTVFTWTWGKITTVTGANSVTINLLGPNLLFNAAISNWRIGVYSDTTGYPTCGCWYEGRLWLAGAVPNRIDASNTNDFFNFAPTAADGTVGDANAISATFNSNDQNEILWLEDTSQGLVAGTKKGEWLIQASSLNDPITPTSIQAHRHTKVGCANVPPIKTPLTLVFVNRYGRMLYELFPDVFSGKMTAPNLNIFSKHLTTAGVSELAYQSELAPVVWARMADGTLAGWTYRRASAFASEEPAFVGAHRTTLGSGRIVESLCGAPTPHQTSSAPVIVSNETATGIRHVEQLTALVDPNSAIWQSWFVDDAVTPSGALSAADGSGITFFGLWHLNGKTCSAVVGGLDCGDHLVTLGAMFVPYQSDPGKLFTKAYMDQLSASGANFGDFGTFLDTTITVTPAKNPDPGTAQLLTWPSNNVQSVDVSLGAGFPDWANSRGILKRSSGNAPGWRNLNFVTGRENLDRTAAQVLSTLPSGDRSAGGAISNVGLDGNFYTYVSSSNSGVVAKIRVSDLTLQGSYGVDSSSLTPGATGWTSPPQSGCNMATCFAGGNFLVGVGIGPSASQEQVQAINTDQMAFVAGSAFTLPENENGIVTGRQGVDVGTAYILGMPGGLGQATLASVHLHEVIVIPPIPVTLPQGKTVTQLLGTIAASAIDPTWTSFDTMRGPAIDKKDGNIIINPGTTINGVSLYYIAKVRASDGTIMWKLPVDGPMGEFPTGCGLIGSRIIGSLAFLSPTLHVGPGTHNLYFIDTIAGSVVSAPVSGIDTIRDQYFDSVTGQIFVSCTASGLGSGGTTPNAFVGSPNNWSANWAILRLGTIFFGSASSVQRDTIPAVIGFTYTTQGQILRPAAQQEAGAANGPAQGKTRRNHMIAVLLAGAITGNVLFGTIFSKLRGAAFKTPGNLPVDTKTLFSGIYWHTVEDNYDFDGMLCWQISRPLPAHVCSISGFINTQDR